LTLATRASGSRVCRYRDIISVATNTALILTSGTFVALLDHDDTLAPYALWAMARHLREHPADDLAYSDEDKLDEVGQR